MKDKYINMLLDVRSIFGKAESRLGPALKYLLIIGVPPLLFVYFLYGTISVKYVIVPYILFCIRLALIILGEEKIRLIDYKKQLFDVYSSSYDLMNIKTIHPDGVLEYQNGMVSIAIHAENGTDVDPILKANSVKDIIEELSVTGYLDCYTQNIPGEETLNTRYDSLHKIVNKKVAKAYMMMIDFFIKKSRRESLVTRTIFVIKGMAYQIEKMESAIDSVMESRYSSVFKVFKRTNVEELKDIIMRDVGTYIDFDEMLSNRFASGGYGDARVLGYDVAGSLENEVTLKMREAKMEVNIRGFMVRAGENK